MPMIPAMIFKTSSLRVCIPVPKPCLHLPQAKGFVLPHLGGAGWKNAGGWQKRMRRRWRQSRTLEIGKAPSPSPSSGGAGRRPSRRTADPCLNGDAQQRSRTSALLPRASTVYAALMKLLPALLFLALLSACALSRPLPQGDVEPAVEPLDPSIKPLTQEQEEQTE
jgi:hypothetical protein